MRNDVLIRVEGMQTYAEFVNNVIKDDEDGSWTNFITYTEIFKELNKVIKGIFHKEE